LEDFFLLEKASSSKDSPKTKKRRKESKLTPEAYEAVP